MFKNDKTPTEYILCKLSLQKIPPFYFSSDYPDYSLILVQNVALNYNFTAEILQNSHDKHWCEKTCQNSQ